MPTPDLRAYLFDAKPHLLSPRVGDWLDQSKRFYAFAETYRDKIRKKLRDTRDREAGRDVGAELETAYLLTQDRRLTVEYEKCDAGTRCPDFTVHFTTSYAFGVEVTRMRPSAAQTLEASEARFSAHVAEKLGQMQAGMPNVLWVVTEALPAEGSADGRLDLAQAMTRLRMRAERQDSTLIGRHGLKDTATFFKFYARLSGVLLRMARDGETSQLHALWANPQAKYPLPAPLRTILQGLT
jgi:hypothetical protein